jgi:hypothetical protein
LPSTSLARPCSTSGAAPVHRWASERARLILSAYAICTAALAIGVALLPSSGGPDPLVEFPWIAGASVAVVGSLVAMAGVWTATGAYAVVFWCFHFGLVAVLGTGLVGIEDLSVWDLSWITGPYAGEAARMALAGGSAFAAGASIVYAMKRGTLTHHYPTETAAPAHEFGTAGSLLVLGGMGVWCAIVVSTGGLGGFFASYGDYLEATVSFGELLGLAWLVTGCGIVLSVSGKSGRLRTMATTAFVALTAVALPLGLRGDVMFRGAAALVAAARCGRVPSVAKALALGVALIVAIPIIREVRQTGLRGLPGAALEPRMYEAFAEMGASLNPVEKVVRWRVEGDPLERGQSYWAPIERAAARLLPGVSTVAVEDDLRITSVLVTARVGAIGFSPVAEAYRNFGAPGVAIVLGLLGTVMAAMDSIRARRTAVLTLAMVYVPLLVNVRNSFVSVPAHCAFGVALILVLGTIRHVVGSVLCRPYARPAYIRSEI